MIVMLSSNAQPVSDYLYKLDNGILLKSEHCWNHVWVQQDYADLKAGDQSPLSVNIRTLGDLTTGSSFKLLKGGKEIKTQGAAPGTYDMKLSFKLTGKPGTLSFVVGNVVIKPKTKTTVSVTLYDYQIAIAETKGSFKGKSSFETKTYKFKGNDLADVAGIPAFYAKGNHDKAISPDESASKTSGLIQPGVYDVLITMDLAGKTQKIWLENFTMKPDIKYSIATNLNGGVMVYSGGNKDVKAMHLYPSGTSASQTGTPAPISNLEIGYSDKISNGSVWAPGAYDVLLATGKKYEWRKNLIIKTGSRTEIK
jgi:hypothetical protein